MGATDCLEPHDEQVMNEILVSRVRIVSGDLHVLHVTYSTVSQVSTYSMGIQEERKVGERVIRENTGRKGLIML